MGWNSCENKAGTKRVCGRRTTATNWELVGNRSGNDTVVPLSGKVWSMTLLTSTLLGAVDAPTGMISTLYGGEPWPSIVRESSLHWVGTLLNLKVYAATREGKRKKGIEKEAMVKKNGGWPLQRSSTRLRPASALAQRRSYRGRRRLKWWPEAIG